MINITDIKMPSRETIKRMVEHSEYGSVMLHEGCLAVSGIQRTSMIKMRKDGMGTEMF